MGRTLHNKVKLVVCLVVSLCISFCILGCEGEKTEGSLSLNKTQIDLKVDQEFQIVPTATNLDGDYAYTTDAASIATVTSTGLVKAVSKGKAIITVKKGNKNATLQVDVADKDAIVADALSVEIIESTKVYLGNLLTLKPIVRLGRDALLTASVTYDSSDKEVATINASGTISPLKYGNTVVTVTASYEGEEVSKDCAVEVTYDTSMMFQSSYFSGIIGETLLSDLKINNEAVDNAECTFSSANPAVASVNADGLITFLTKGTTIITAKLNSNSAEIEVVSCNQEINTKAEFFAILGEKEDRPETDRIDGYYVLGADIDFQFDPTATVPMFRGRLEGNGYAIKNVAATIFETLGEGGHINNLAILGAKLPEAEWGTGILVSNGYDDPVKGSTISNIYAEVDIEKDAAAIDRGSGTLVGVGYKITCRNIVVKANCIAPTVKFIGAIVGNTWQPAMPTIIENCIVISNKNLSFNVRNVATTVTNSTVFANIAEANAAIESFEFDASSFDQKFWNTSKFLPLMKQAPTLDFSTTEIDADKSITLSVTFRVDYEVQTAPFTFSITEGAEFATLTGNVLIGNKAGSIKLKVSTTVGGVEYSKIYEIKVLKDVVITLDKSVVNLSLRDTDNALTSTLTASATINDEVIASPAIVWTSSDKAVATVDATGKITVVNTPVFAGDNNKTTITAAYEGKSVSCEVTVYYGFIKNIDEMFNMRGLTAERASERTYLQTADIDAKSNASYLVPGNFYGHFNGNGYSIFNLTAPVFETIGSDGTHSFNIIENLKLVGKLGDKSGGLLANVSNGIVKNIYAEVTMVGNSTHARAGLVGSTQINQADTKWSFANCVVELKFEGVTDYSNISALFTGNAADEYAYAAARIIDIIVISPQALPITRVGHLGKLWNYGVYTSYEAYKTAVPVPGDRGKADMSRFSEGIWDITEGYPEFISK